MPLDTTKDIVMPDEYVMAVVSALNPLVKYKVVGIGENARRVIDPAVTKREIKAAWPEVTFTKDTLTNLTKKWGLLYVCLAYSEMTISGAYFAQDNAVCGANVPLANTIESNKERCSTALFLHEAEIIPIGDEALRTELETQANVLPPRAGLSLTNNEAELPLG